MSAGPGPGDASIDHPPVHEDTATGLQRAIGLQRATAMVVGTIIGASIFVQPSEITGQVPSALGIYAVWAVSGLITLLGALVIAELASAFPHSGGVYVYLRESFSPALGFLWGWAMFWTMHTGIMAAIATIFARYVAYFVPLGNSGIRGVAIAAVLLLTWINVLGVRHGSLLQAVFTWGKVAAVLAIIALGFAFGGPAHEVVAAAPAPSGDFGGVEFLLALVAGLFAYGGWHMVTYNAGETYEPRRTIPRALVLGIVIVTACYIALNAVYLHVLPLDAVATSDRVAADAADAIFGTGGGAAMSAIVIFSTFGALSGVVLAGPRVYHAMARDGLLFSWFRTLHPTYHTPHRAIVLQGLWACVLIGTGTYRALFTRVVYTEWIFFGLMAVGLIVLRRRGIRGEAPVPGYPWVPILFAGAAFLIVANQIVAEPLDSALGLGMILLGLPVYLWAARHRTRTETG